ncbi:hypothetical protein CHCC20333_3493 [Bacillus paralicheniformis]|nr:hypothetical protein CHCC20333_3493 [Bacillus paralicheniformis]
MKKLFVGIVVSVSLLAVGVAAAQVNSGFSVAGFTVGA